MANLPGSQTTYYGTNGNDTIVGTPLDDLLHGRGGADSIDGVDGNDYLEGAVGNDSMLGGPGNDWLIGGSGNDRYTGGSGSDQFRFYGYDVAAGGLNTDTVTDLTFGEGDVLVLANFAAGTFKGIDVNGKLDLINSGEGPGSGANVRSWSGLVDLVVSSPAVTAARLGNTDTLLLQIASNNGATQVIAIENGWSVYNGLTNKAPVAAADTASVLEDASATGNLLANDSDPDGDAISLTGLKHGAGPNQPVPSSGTVVINGTYGTITVAANGSYTYLAANAAAQALSAGTVVQDAFTYVVTDSAGNTSTAQLTIQVTGTNDAPVAKALAGTVSENGPAITFQPDFNDVDQGDSHEVSVGQASKGLVTLNGNGTFSYDPNGKFEALGAGQTATDSFTYTVKDGAGASSTKTVTVTILGANDTPSSMADFNGVVKNGEIAVDASNGVLANDKDIDSDTLSVSALNGSAANLGKSIQGDYGALTMNADGSYSYVANTKPGSLPAKAVAQDEFSYTVSDGNGGFQTQTLTITVYDKGQTYMRGTDGANSMSGGNGSDVLDGGNGNDTLVGGNGPDVLLGGRGNDVMTGNSGPDTFVFNDQFGQDVITDFTAGQDLIQFDQDVFASYGAMLAAATQAGSDVLINAGGGNVITLQGVQLSNLQANDFLFV